MKLGLRVGSAVVAFIAGAAVVHCGTTDFASAVDGGADGGGSHGSSSSTSGTSSPSSTTSGPASSTMSASGSSTGSESAACTLSADCTTKNYDCCYSFATNTTACDPTPCASPTFKTCTVPANCLLYPGGGYCCVAEAGKMYGVCASPAECAALPGEIKCTVAADCPSGESCSGDVCVAEGSGSSASGGSGTGTGSGCTPGTCATLYSGKCGTGLPNGCGAKSLDCMCVDGTCSVSATGSEGTCGPVIGSGSGGCPAGSCGGTCCVPPEVCNSGVCETCIACGVDPCCGSAPTCSDDVCVP